MQEKEQRRSELITKLYERVCQSILEKRRLRIIMRDPLKKRIELIVEPHYSNIDWEGDLFMIAKRVRGPAPYAERKGWIIIFLKEIRRYTLLKDAFEPDIKLHDYIEEFAHTVIRPSEYELYIS